MDTKNDNNIQLDAECPICCKKIPQNIIESHANRCIFLNSTNEDEKHKQNEKKRSFNVFGNTNIRSPTMDKKKLKKTDKSPSIYSQSIKEALSLPQISGASKLSGDGVNDHASVSSTRKIAITKPSEFAFFDKKCDKHPSVTTKAIPLAEKMRPQSIDDYIGQSHIMGKNTILRKIFDKNEIPSMILWGPPGVGKTTLAHIIANRCKSTQSIRFIKFSATMVGVNDIKQAVAVAKSDQKYQKKTILFLDEIHRFNKLQQDIFLPHVESGTITLIGATTENPSFSLNSALLSRCRVIVLEKLTTQNIYEILRRSLNLFEAVILDVNDKNPSIKGLGFIPKIAVEESSLQWLAGICDGDARIALNSLQLAMESIKETDQCDKILDLKFITLSSIQDGIKRSHMLYDRQGDQHYDMISALHKSIRASDDNAALYWCTRMLNGGEDPRYICRRLVRAASEDIGLADPNAVGIALSALEAVQLVGMPESDCIIAQTAVYLARAPKSREVYDALGICKRDIQEWNKPLPAVPLHLRNAPTKLMRELEYGKGYNMRQKEDSGLNYMPDGMESREYFRKQ